MSGVLETGHCGVISREEYLAFPKKNLYGSFK